jgi:transcriptional regulator with XRE-family HTH domain
MSAVPENPRDVVASLLTDRRLLAACAERDMGTLFRLLNHRGISTRRIAAAVDITQGRLYEYMNGKSRVEKLSVFEQIADALHIPGRLLGLAKRPWEPDVSAASAGIAWTVHTAAPSSDDDMGAVSAFRSADRRTGGGRLYRAATRHLAEKVAPRLVDPEVTPQIFAVAAALTEMAGWMAHDSGHDSLAARHFGRAIPLARASGDTPLTAGIAASSSHLSLQTGDTTAAIHWARTGLEAAAQGPMVPALTARLYAMYARALAATGQTTAALAAIDQGESHLGRQPEADLPWLSPFDSAALAAESALVHTDLQRYEDAQRSAEQAIRLRETGRARSLAFSRIALTTVHVHRNNLDAAVGVGNELLAADPYLGSVRVVRQLERLRQLLDPHRTYRPVDAFLTRLDDARRDRMLLLADIISPPYGGTST